MICTIFAALEKAMNCIQAIQALKKRWINYLHGIVLDIAEEEMKISRNELSKQLSSRGRESVDADEV